MRARKSKKSISLKWAFLVSVLAIVGCSTSAEIPLEGKPDHHVKEGFRNYPVIPEPPPTKSGFYWRRFWTSFFLPDVPEGHVLPEFDSITQYNQFQDQNSITWLGHATFLINLDGKTILTDPYLTKYASPVAGFGPRRFAPPGISIKNLPPIDVIVVSHNHLDHLDARTVKAIPNKENIRVFVPLGLKSFFLDMDYKHVEELDWNESGNLGSVKFTALPSVHHSGRSIGDKNETLWCSWSIKSSSEKIYFIGDSGYSETIFKEIGAIHGPYDLALVTIGAYDVRQGKPTTHIYPEEAVKIGLEVNAKAVVAMHWGTLQLSDEPPFEPPIRFRKAALDAGYSNENTWVMKIGETRPIHQ